MAKPKLALIPATQGSKLYSVLPADGVGDFTFSRGSAATRINKDGLIETVAVGKSRLNYPLIDGKVVGCPSHLLEPSSTNLILNSESLNSSSFDTGGTGSTVLTPNYGISPDGTLNADRVQLTRGSTYREFYQRVNVINGATYTLSFWAKSLDGTPTLYTAWNDGYFNEVTFTNEWVRYEYTFTEDSSNENNLAGFNLLTYNSYPSTSLNADLLIWGVQLEQKSFSTSYILTTTSATTRVAETANGAGDASTFSDSDGVLMVEISALANDGTFKIISIKNSSSNAYENTLNIQYTATSNQIAAVYRVGNSSLVVFIYNMNSSITNSKVCFKYKSGDFAMWVDGFEVGQSANTTMIPNGTLSEILFSRSDNIGDFYGNTKQLQYFDSALNDSDLETLTSWTSFTDLANGQQYSIK